MLLTIAVGALGGYIAKKLKIPGGLLVGAMVSVAVLNICFASAKVVSEARVATQILAGAFSGCIITKKDVKRMPNMIGPILLVVVTFIFTNIVVSLLFTKAFSMSFITASFSLIPGSATNTPIIAEDYGAKVSTVAILQIVRLFAGIGFFPSLIHQVGIKLGELTDEKSRPKMKERQAESVQSSHKISDVLITLFISTAAGLFGWYIKFPGGPLAFSMIGVMCLNVIKGNAYLPRWMKYIAQIVCGCYIGSLIAMEDILNLKNLILPALIIVLVYSIDCLLMGYLLNKRHGYKICEGMLMAIPAGASDMLLIASDVGIEDADIVIVHIVRAIAAASLFPVLMGFLNNYLG